VAKSKDKSKAWASVSEWLKDVNIEAQKDEKIKNEILNASKQKRRQSLSIDR